MDLEALWGENRTQPGESSVLGSLTGRPSIALIVINASVTMPRYGRRRFKRKLEMRHAAGRPRRDRFCSAAHRDDMQPRANPARAASLISRARVERRGRHADR